MTQNEDVSSDLRLLTVDEIVELLRLSRDTIFRLATSGELPGGKIGRTWRFPSDAVEAYVRQGQGCHPSRGGAMPTTTTHGDNEAAAPVEGSQSRTASQSSSTAERSSSIPTEATGERAERLKEFAC